MTSKQILRDCGLQVQSLRSWSVVKRSFRDEVIKACYRVAAFANPMPRHQMFGQKTVGNETSLHSGVIGFARPSVPSLPAPYQVCDEALPMKEAAILSFECIAKKCTCDLVVTP